MAEYIERESLLKVLPPKCNMGDMYATAYNTCLNIIENLIKEQPTADVVEVVRCKDCKHCRKPKGKEKYRYFEGVLLCESYEMSDDVCAVNPDDYCSYGERRCDNDS